MRKIWEVLRELKDRAIFFLDGHFSWWDTAKWVKECPLLLELDHFKKSKIKDHIIVIDDIRLCWKDPAYPTVDILKNNLLSINPNYNIYMKNDQMIAFIN